MVIEELPLAAHCPAMPSKPETLLPDNLQAEMRPERIGQRLSLLRRALELSPAEIADSLDIERTYWSRFENGRRALTESVAALLVVRYGVTLDWLILGKWDSLPFSLAQKMRAIAAGDPKNN